MATYDYIRSVETDLNTKEDMKFNPVFAFARDDSGSVDWSGKTLKFEVFSGSTLVTTLTSGTEITIETDTLTFNKTFTELEKRGYDYRLYNSTDSIGIMHGKLYVK